MDSEDRQEVALRILRANNFLRNRHVFANEHVNTPTGPSEKAFPTSRVQSRLKNRNRFEARAQPPLSAYNRATDHYRTRG